MTLLDAILDDTQEQIEDMMDRARDNTHRMLVRHGATPDQIDEVMDYLERGMHVAVCEQIALLKYSLRSALATRH